MARRTKANISAFIPLIKPTAALRVHAVKNGRITGIAKTEEKSGGQHGVEENHLQGRKEGRGRGTGLMLGTKLEKIHQLIAS